MAGDVSELAGTHAPVIILYGDAVRDMGEERRRDIAISLETLLGVHAIAREVGIEYLGDSVNDQRPATETHGPAEPLPPFTLLIHSKNPWNRRPGINEHIQAANDRAPGVIEDDVIVKRAFSFIAGHAYRSILQWPFTAHFAPEEEGKRDRKLLLAVTFDDPQAFIDHPELVQESISGLGPKTVRALAQFATAITQTQTP